MNCILSARRLLTSRRNWLYLRRERLHLSARSKHSRSYAASAKDRNVTNACVGTGRLRERRPGGAYWQSPAREQTARERLSGRRRRARRERAPERAGLREAVAGGAFRATATTGVGKRGRSTLSA